MATSIESSFTLNYYLITDKNRRFHNSGLIPDYPTSSSESCFLPRSNKKNVLLVLVLVLTRMHAGRRIVQNDSGGGAAAEANRPVWFLMRKSNASWATLVVLVLVLPLFRSPFPF